MTVKQFLESNEQTVIKLTEASAITGSGTGEGGRSTFTPAESALRMTNPLRKYARQIPSVGSDALFVQRVGNATDTTPWGYTVQTDPSVPNYDTAFWQLPVQSVSFTLPIRTAVLADVQGLAATVERDIYAELGTLEGLSMMRNNDQAGSTTTATGGTVGLRGLATYGTGTAAYGTSGRAITNGVHTIANVNYSLAAASSAKYDAIVNITNTLPAQYWMQESTCWMVHPAMITALRQLKDNNGLPMFLEMGDYDAAAVGMMFGFPVYPNSNLQVAGATIAAGDVPLYLAAWEPAVTIVSDSVTLERYEQTAPGIVTIFGQLRTCSTIADPFAIVRCTVTA